MSDTEVKSHSKDAQILCIPLSPSKAAISQAIKLPPFSQQNTASWFLQADVHFRVTKIKDEKTKADVTMTTLPEVVFNKITPWLDSQPGKVKYRDLRDNSSTHTPCPSQRWAQCALNLMTQPLGDTSPRDAWDELRGLLMLPGIDSDGGGRSVGGEGTNHECRRPLNGRIGERLAQTQ